MNIQDLMTDDLSKVAQFEAACNDMIDARYILAEDRIIKIMHTVALSRVLQRIITGALKGFDYGAAARNCFNNGGFNPASEKDHVALVFCILADIDNHKIYLNDFLREFFWEGEINASYASFCATLIAPFRDYVTGALKQAQGNAYEQPKDQSCDWIPEQSNEIYESQPSKLERKAMDLVNAIENYNGFSQLEKEEYIFMCDSIATKGRDDISGARALAIGLKRLVGSVPEIAPFMEDVIGELGY